MSRASHISTNFPSVPRVKRGLDPTVLFAAEGAMLQFVIAANAFGNNLYASSLGASDTQIGLIQMVPNVAAMLLLIPVGVLADRLRSTKTIPLAAALCQAAGFLLMASVPLLGAYRTSGLPQSGHQPVYPDHYLYQLYFALAGRSILYRTWLGFPGAGHLQ